ncbi:insulinase family protein [Alteromonas sp. C1M14]|uniref:insulinase family protein n=1 Tax=Alteromonas sp. C1M14 TaxID=2841567 RepID=UPI001C09A9F9|nr:insulinase family protein [Alteromonas sp. C1M14]MBU2977368.1 insulinase family protein [Alteromonas sp. C1M14]
MTTSINLEQAQFVTLENGLRILICEQNLTPSTFVSMSVKAGHFYDPDCCHGLSHLLEHMMFLGSRHLPKPNSINDMVEKAGGNINAWTGTEFANYHFSCHSEQLDKLLPAFSDMLRLPLLDKATLNKEINAIDAEFQFKRKDDLRRLYQIHKETANPAHPFSKFSVGNASIFRALPENELHQQLHAFHSQYYVAKNMALTVFTSEKADRVKNIITHSFSAIKAGDSAAESWPALYTDDQLAVEINIEPLQSARRMIVTFALPGLHHDFRTKPLNYLSHLLGDEGEGSLLAYLKSKNWVTNLIAGSGIEGKDFKDFNVSFQLTRSGLENKQHLLEALFSYIRLIQNSVDEKWRYQEKAHLGALAHEFEDNPKLQAMACEYAQHLFYYKEEDIRQFKIIIDNFDKTKIAEALSYFTPNNIRIKLIAQGLPTDTTCQHYDARYQLRPLSPSVLEALCHPPTINALTLPPPNPYLGMDYHLALPETDYLSPKTLIDSPHMKFWFAQDDVFHNPKGDIYVSFDTQALTDDLHAVAAKRIWLSALNDFLQAKYYRAEIAGLHYRIYGHQAGFTLHTRGFSNNQSKLALQLLETIHEFMPDQQQFERVKAMQIQSLQNALMNKPTNRLFSRLSVIVQRNTQAPIELLKAVEACTYKSMTSTCLAALKHYYVESFMHGNWSKDEACQFANQLAENSIGATGKALTRSVSQLPVGEALYHEVPCDHPDAAVVLYLQAPSNSIKDTAMCMVLEQMLAAPFFNVLRTEKQLGYVVGTGYVPHNQHPGMAFYIQSPTHAPDVLLKEMTTFLFEQLNEIDFYQFYWSTIQKNLLKQLEERDLSLSMKSQRLWGGLGSQETQFDRNQKLASEINQTSFTDIQHYANALAKRTLFGELVLYASGGFSSMSVPAERSLTNLAMFKKNTPYFPIP